MDHKPLINLVKAAVDKLEAIEDKNVHEHEAVSRGRVFLRCLDQALNARAQAATDQDSVDASIEAALPKP